MNATYTTTRTERTIEWIVMAPFRAVFYTALGALTYALMFCGPIGWCAILGALAYAGYRTSSLKTRGQFEADRKFNGTFPRLTYGHGTVCGLSYCAMCNAYMQHPITDTARCYHCGFDNDTSDMKSWPGPTPPVVPAIPANYAPWRWYALGMVVAPVIAALALNY